MPGKKSNSPKVTKNAASTTVTYGATNSPSECVQVSKTKNKTTVKYTKHK